MGTGTQDGATAGGAPPGTRALHAYLCLVAQLGGGLVQVSSLGPPSQMRAQIDTFVAAYNATAHPCEWTTQVVCPKHLQVSTCANECNHVLVYCLTNGFTTPGLRQKVFNCISPHERLVVFVTEPNELLHRFDQLRHTLKDAARDSLARGSPEPALDQVQPGGTRRGNVQMKPWMLRTPCVHIGRRCVPSLSRIKWGATKTSQNLPEPT